MRDIYQYIYTLRYIGGNPIDIKLLPFREIRGIRSSDGHWELAAAHLASQQQEVFKADVVIWASGFRPAALPFLAPLLDGLERENNELKIDQDFAAVWRGPRNRSLFLVNAVRRQRGLADPNLSLMAWRSQIIIDRMLGKPRDRSSKEPSFVTWVADARSQLAEQF